MSLDQYRVTEAREIRLAVGRPAYFAIVGDDRKSFELNGEVNSSLLRRVVMGSCKRVVIQHGTETSDYELIGMTDPDAMTRKLRYIMGTAYSVGLVVERVRGKSCLVAMLLTQEAVDDAVEAFAEIDEDVAEEGGA